MIEDNINDMKYIKHYFPNEKQQSNVKDHLNEVKRKRIVSNTELWKSTILHLNLENQYDYISNINNIENIVIIQIRNKINGYKSQDKKKKIFCSEKFIDFEFVIKLFHSSLIKCYYCNEQVSILYDSVRDPKQWTIERIENNMGHNKDNVVIACLNCNLKRRTMYHQRYLMTKQLIIVKSSNI